MGKILANIRRIRDCWDPEHLSKHNLPEETRSIPMVIHVYEGAKKQYDSEKDDYVDDENLFDRYITILNEEFSPHRMEFYADEIVEHDEPCKGRSGRFLGRHKDTLDDRVNMQLCQMGYTYQRTRRSYEEIHGRAFVGSGYFYVTTRDLRTAIHEMGHALGLLHTFDSRGGKELVNGENALWSGDYIADTPADPGVDACEVELEVYSGLATRDQIDISCGVDANGDAYQPDPLNHMSDYSDYFPFEAPIYDEMHFTPGQGALMNCVLDHRLGVEE